MSKQVRVTGTLELIPELAKVLPEAPDLLDQLATEFAPQAAELATPIIYWTAFNQWLGDRLVRPIMVREAGDDVLKPYAWVVYVTSYWAALTTLKNFGPHQGMARMGLADLHKPPFVELQQNSAINIGLTLDAVADRGPRCLEMLPAMLRGGLGSQGAIGSFAYNSSMAEFLSQPPPLGAKLPTRTSRPSPIRINARDFMRVDYYLPTPEYIREWRVAFERAVVTDPDAYERLIAGAPDDRDLREAWKQGYAQPWTTRGEGATDDWTDDYYDETVYWVTVTNFGIEAVALAAMTAAINSDPDAARLAVMANLLFDVMAPGFLRGFLDTDGDLPDVG